MQTKTVDLIVRECLGNMGYPLHYYFPMLNHALQGLESISQDTNIGTNVKEVKVSVNSYNRASIPNTGVVDIIGVYGRYGDEYKAFHLNENITLLYNLEGENKIPYPLEESTMPDFIDSKSSAPMIETSARGVPTVLFPSDDYKYEYNIDVENDEVVLSTGHGVDFVYIRYLTTSVSSSSANVVHPYAVDTIRAYIEYMFSKSDGSPQSKVAVNRSNYFNEERLFRARVNPLTYNELAQILYNS